MPLYHEISKMAPADQGKVTSEEIFVNQFRKIG